jgi:uncharacterized OB-fold protein
VAGRCSECRELSFPPAGACQVCHERTDFEDVPLPRSGTVETCTAIQRGGAPPEFAEQQRRSGSYTVAHVRIETDDSSVRVPAQIVTHGSGAVSPGDPVEAVIRQIYEQEGVVRYGVKFTPLE